LICRVSKKECRFAKLKIIEENESQVKWCDWMGVKIRLVKACYLWTKEEAKNGKMG
jgi:hypothetical protein